MGRSTGKGKKLKLTKVAVPTAEELLGMDVTKIPLPSFLGALNLKDQGIRVRLRMVIQKSRETRYPGLGKARSHSQYAEDCKVTEAAERMWENGTTVPMKVRLEQMVRGKLLDLRFWNIPQ